MNTTAYILALIKTKGFVEAKNINQLAKELGIKPENLRHIILAIQVANMGEMPKARHDYQDYYFKDKKRIGNIMIIYKWADESKKIFSDKINEILGLK